MKKLSALMGSLSLVSIGLCTALSAGCSSHIDDEDEALAGTDSSEQPFDFDLPDDWFFWTMNRAAMMRDTDLPGRTLGTLAPSPNTAEGCRDACDREELCAAYTYTEARGNTAGSCALKSSVPARQTATGKISGIKGTGEWNWERRGHALRTVSMAGGYRECRALCFQDRECKAVTYFPPTAEGDHAKCKLQDGLSTPVFTSGATSGVVFRPVGQLRHTGFDLRLPSESALYDSPLDNPLLSGSVSTADMTVESENGSVSQGFEVVLVGSNNASLFPAGKGYTQLDLNAWRPPGYHRGFLTVAAELPRNGAEASIWLTRRGGPDGVTHPNTNTMRMRLAPDVLMVPVHLRVMTSPEGELPNSIMSEEGLRALFDPGSVVKENETSYYDPHEQMTKYTVTTRNAPSRLPIDHIFAKCGIQFRVASYQQIAQNEGLDEHFANEDELCGFNGETKICTQGDTSRMTAFFKRHRPPATGIPIFFGGPAQGNCGGHTWGVTCSRRCAFDDFKHGDTSDGWLSNDNYVAVSPHNLPVALAHEVGHYIGIEHSSGPENCGMNAAQPNLMVSGGAQPERLESNRLSDVQCKRARCVVERWRVRWGLAERGTEVDCTE